MADISQVNLPNDNNSPYNIKDATVPHSSLTAVSGGTALSLVTTGEKYEWNWNGVDHYSTTIDYQVGVWLDGSPIYRRTIEYSSNKTISADNSIDIPTTDWNLKAIPIDIVLYRYGNISSQSQMVIRSCFAAINNSGKLSIFNTRNAAITFNAFSIQYIRLV